MQKRTAVGASTVGVGGRGTGFSTFSRNRSGLGDLEPKGQDCKDDPIINQCCYSKAVLVSCAPFASMTNKIVYLVWIDSLQFVGLHCISINLVTFLIKSCNTLLHHHTHTHFAYTYTQHIPYTYVHTSIQTE